MFSQLLSQCESVFKSADQTLKQNKQILTQSKYLTQKLNQPNIDPTKVSANCISFSKSQRFKIIEKQQIKLNDLSICQSQWRIQQDNFNNLIKKDKKNNFTFTRSQRFIEKKQIEPQSILYPNIQITKKNTKAAPIIKPSSSKDLSKSNISQMTTDTLNEVGPGKYFIQNIDKQKRSAAFSKQKRFHKQKTVYQDNPLFINQTQTRKRPPTAAIMKKKIIKNAKLISKQQQQQLRQRLKMVYWQSIPLQLDRLFKNQNGPVIKDNYFDIKKMSGREKRCAILMMLDRLNWLRGGFENDIATKIQKEGRGAVAYRKSTPKPFKFSEMQPGPDYYYPQDDLTKPGLIGFSFAKQGQQPQKLVYDDRDYEINQQIFKKGGNIIINPVHKQQKLTEDQLKALQRGPGFYDCLFGQVEKRDDIGVMKFTEITQKNARQNNCVQIKKDVNDAVYFPSYQAIDPNIPAPLYKQKANVQPIHLPDKVLFPEHWLFYDGDLNKVKAEIAKNVILSKNMDFNTYKQYTKRFEAFKNYLKSRQPKPEVGEYEVNYKQIDAHVQGFELAKMQQKTLIQPIVKQEGEVDGDNLILNPKQLQDHLPNFDFKKLVGRQNLQEQPSQFDEPKQGDRLILEPKKLEKKLPNIKFEKYIGRQDNNINDQLDPNQPPEGNVLILNPKQIEKHIPQINMAKQSQKNQPEIIDLHDDQEQIIINPYQQNRKIKGFVEMQRMSAVRLVPALKRIKETTIRSKSKHKKSQAYSQNNQDKDQ